MLPLFLTLSPLRRARQRFILPADVVKGARDEPEKYERRAKFLGLRSPREGAAAQVWLAQAGGEAGRSGPQGLVYTDPGAKMEGGDGYL